MPYALLHCPPLHQAQNLKFRSLPRAASDSFALYPSTQRHPNPFVSLAMENPTAGDQAAEWYSVWALPPEDVGARLKRLMADLRSAFGGPEFEPHITVVGAIRLSSDDAVRRLRSACAALSPYSATVASAARGNFFYQCVYLLIDPSPEVTQTSAHCCDHFAYKNSASYMPHLSLLYGDLTDEEKEKARQRVEELDKEICGLTFQISALALYKTDTEDKSLKSWEKVEVCYLGSDN